MFTASVLSLGAAGMRQRGAQTTVDSNYQHLSGSALVFPVTGNFRTHIKHSPNSLTV